MSTFLELQTQIRELKNQINDLVSQVYYLHTHPDEYCTIAYYDHEDAHRMNFTLLCNNMECKLLADVPHHILIAHIEVVKVIKSWENGEIENFPYELSLPEDLDDDSPEPLLK